MAAPRTMQANVTGALKARTENADNPCPMLHPMAITAPNPISTAPLS